MKNGSFHARKPYHPPAQRRRDRHGGSHLGLRRQLGLHRLHLHHAAPPRQRRLLHAPRLAAATACCCHARLRSHVCRQPASSAAPAATGKKVTLTFWGTYGNGGNKTQTDALSKTIIPAFEKANPNITINYVDIPYDSLLQKLTTSAAGGQLPDLVRSDIGWVLEVRRARGLRPARRAR